MDFDASAFGTYVRQGEWAKAARITRQTSHHVRLRYDPIYARKILGTPPPIAVEQITDADFPQALRERVNARLVNGKPMTFAQFGSFSGIHPGQISFVACGKQHRQNDIVMRIREALKRLDVTTDVELLQALSDVPPRKKSPISEDRIQWATAVKNRLADIPMTPGHFANVIGCSRHTICNIINHRYGASRQKMKLIDMWLDRLEAQKREKAA